MNHFKLILPIILFVFVGSLLNGQALVTLDPPFPTADNATTITFDASQGNAGLLDMPSNQDVYAHIGLKIGTQNWQFVIGTWGTADARVKMTRIGTSNFYTLSLNPSIRDWFVANGANVPLSANITGLSMVFRNVDGTREGKTAVNGDIFIDLYTNQFAAAITSHPQQSILVNSNATVPFTGQSSANCQLDFFLDGVNVATQASTTSLVYQCNTNSLTGGLHELVFVANIDTAIIRDTLLVTVHNGVTIAEVPTYGSEGIIYPNATTAYLQLRAPFKEFIYVLGDFNNWQFLPEYNMKRTADGQHYWIEITGLDPNQEYRFQYHIGWEGQRVTDPYCEKILDPNNDQYITGEAYPENKDYPSGKGAGIVGVLQTQYPAYTWDNSYTYNRPPKSDLVIYECWIHDFSTKRNFTGLIEKIPYLKTLGINALELMPVAEYEGNESWGYNPMFFMAVDKFYGTRNEFKRLVDSCHANGIAVIMDVVFNHSFGQNPMVQMYFNNGAPTGQSPWFNTVARHPFNVGYDFNHESQATKYFVKKVTKHWIDEYKLDGYRFDLSKGFTQTNTGSDVGAWGNYDQSRVNIINEYAAHIRQTDPNSHLILEHLGVWDEEIQYANNGMMVWAKGTEAYNQATMGFINNMNLYESTHWRRGWNNYGMVTYAESHDEERLMYKNLNFGNASGGYNTRDLGTAVNRMAAANTFLIAIPGPKMIWQFGELGYDYSINRCSNGSISTDCRTASKPVRWDYYSATGRRACFEVTRKMNYLKTNYPVMRDLYPQYSLGDWTKFIKYDSNDLDVIIVGNFNVVNWGCQPYFTQSGKWYDYLTGDSLTINNTDVTLNLAAGEFHVYTNKRIKPPVNNYEIVTGVNEIAENEKQMVVFPNPFSDEIFFRFPETPNKNTDMRISDISGRIVKLVSNISLDPLNSFVLNTNDLKTGIYFYSTTINGKSFTGKIIKQ